MLTLVIVLLSVLDNFIVCPKLYESLTEITFAHYKKVLKVCPVGEQVIKHRLVK